MARTLRERVLTALPNESAGSRELLEQLVTAAGAHGLTVDEDLLGDAICSSLAQGVALEELELADLYLVAACARGDSDALRRFEAILGGDLDRAISKSPTLGLRTDEFRQLVLDRLFVRAPDGPPRATKYLGRGPLRAWLRVMTSRFIIDLSRRRDRAIADDDLANKLDAREDTELDYLRQAYGPLLQAAFEEALGSLSIRQRNLLRQRYLHEVSADALATMYGVHRSTMFLWLDKARDALLSAVHAAVVGRLPDQQLSSLVGVLGSQLHLSVRRLLDSRLESET